MNIKQLLAKRKISLAIKKKKNANFVGMCVCYMVFYSSVSPISDCFL